MTYVEGFVLAVPPARKEEFRKHAAEARALVQAIRRDPRGRSLGRRRPRRQGHRLQGRGEGRGGRDCRLLLVRISGSKAARDAANEKMRSDPRMEAMGASMPFDGKRMIIGGFTPIVEESAGGAMGYADGFVVPVPDGKKEAYREMAAKAAVVFKEYGATRVVEGWGDDVPDGKVTDFRRAVKAEDGRECRLFLDRMAVQGGPRRRLAEGHGGRADEARLRQHAVRRQAHVLGRLRPDHRPISERNRSCPISQPPKPRPTTDAKRQPASSSGTS